MTDRPPLADIEAQVVTFTAEQFGISLDRISLDSQPVDDLGIDSLDMIEWFMALEEHFQVSLPEPEVSGDQVYKEVFTRNGFTLRDMAELVHLRWGHPPKRPSEGTGAIHTPARRSSFSQLGGVLESMPGQLYRAIGRTEGGLEQYRRMTDGMTCVHLPGGEVEIGSEDPDAGADERPLHLADLAPFLMDTEVVSATAYCRFLNSIGPVADDSLKAWFWIAEGERRHQHQLIRRNGTWWEPRAGTAEWPMVLVSWHGANAYSLWANGKDWQGWRAAPGPHLPTEAQWEYAARGPTSRRWPWGNRDPVAGEINAGIHVRHGRYGAVTDLPLRAVNERSAVSPFGLLQMAGNVWQWCRDWYDPKAYARAGNGTATVHETGIRSERGGSWVGAISLARSSYRRGRAPHAKGRCLGFRCIGLLPA